MDTTETTTDQEAEQVRATEADKKQVAEWLERTKVPAFLQPVFRRAAADRKYLHTDMISADDPNTVTSPDLLRSIWAKQAQMWPDNPEPVVRPPDEVEPSDEDATDGMATDMMMEVGMPVDPVAEWKAARRKKERISRTASVILSKMGKFAQLGETLQEGGQEAFTVGVVWLKVGWDEDYSRDMLGRRVTRKDGQDQALKLKQLTRDYARGLFTKDDAKFKEMQDLTTYVQRAAMAKMAEMQQGMVAGDDPRMKRLQAMQDLPPGAPLPPHLMPEVERWQCGTVDIVELEDIRLDWGRVRSMRNIDRGRYICERVWMAPDEIDRRFDITEEEKKQLGKKPVGSSSSWLGYEGVTRSETTDPENKDIEAKEHNGDIAVWECHSIENGTIYWVTEGIERVLDDQIPDLSTPWGHPYLAIGFNKVSGRFYCLSDVYLGQKSQDALNQTLTDDWEAAIAGYPFYATKDGYLDDDDLEAIENRQKHRVVQLSRSASEVKDAIQKFPGEEYHPEKFQMAAAGHRQNIERAIGVSSEQLQGKSQYKFATQSAIAQDAAAAQSSRMGKMLVASMSRVYEAWLSYAMACMPEAQAKAWAGSFAYWPAGTREDIALGLWVEVVTSGNRGTRRQDVEDMTASLQGIQALFGAKAAAAQVGVDLDIRPYLDRINAGMDMRLPAARVLKQAPLPGMMPGMMPGAPGAPGPAGAPASGQDLMAKLQGMPTEQLEALLAQFGGGGGPASAA